MQLSKPMEATAGAETSGLTGATAAAVPAGRTPTPSPTAKTAPAALNRAGILPKCLITILIFRPCFGIFTRYARFLAVP